MLTWYQQLPPYTSSPPFQNEEDFIKESLPPSQSNEEPEVSLIAMLWKDTTRKKHLGAGDID